MEQIAPLSDCVMDRWMDRQADIERRSIDIDRQLDNRIQARAQMPLLTSDGNNSVINGVTFSVTSNLIDISSHHYNAVTVTAKDLPLA